MTVLKVETDILNNIAASPIGQIVILGMFVKTFKTDVIVFIGNVIIYLMSHWRIIFTIRVNSLILTISLGKNKDFKKNVQITDKLIILELCFLLVNIPPLWPLLTRGKSVRSDDDLLFNKSMCTHASVILVFLFLAFCTVKSNVYKTIWW
jgi:hypothetical protein